MDTATQMVIDGQQAFGMINAILWTMLRTGALLMAAPLIGTRAVSVRVRVIIAGALAMALAPLLPGTPDRIAFDASTVLNVARELDLLTVGYAFNEEDTERLMRSAAPDVYVFHAGITRGGTTGDQGAASLEDTARRSQAHFALARRLQPDVLLLAHGAALADPQDAQYLLDHTDCDGVQLGSGIERLAIEGPLQERAAAFKRTHFPARRPAGA